MQTTLMPQISVSDSARRRLDSNAVDRYKAAISELRALLSDGGYHAIHPGDFRQKHKITASFIHVLEKMNAIQVRPGGYRPKEYRRLDALATIQPEEILRFNNAYEAERRKEPVKKATAPLAPTPTPRRTTAKVSESFNDTELSVSIICEGGTNPGDYQELLQRAVANILKQATV